LSIRACHFGPWDPGDTAWHISCIIILGSGFPKKIIFFYYHKPPDPPTSNYICKSRGSNVENRFFRCPRIYYQFLYDAFFSSSPYSSVHSIKFVFLIRLYRKKYQFLSAKVHWTIRVSQLCGYGCIPISPNSTFTFATWY
jgi:hypothetical protein